MRLFEVSIFSERYTNYRSSTCLLEVLIYVYLKCRSLARDALIIDLEIRLFRVLIFSERYTNYKPSTCLFKVLKSVYLKY